MEETASSDLRNSTGSVNNAIIFCPLFHSGRHTRCTGSGSYGNYPHLMLIREDYQYLLSFKVIDMHCRQINVYNCPRSKIQLIVVIVFIPALSKVVTNPAPTMPTTFTKSPSTMCRKPTPTSAGAGGLFSSGPSPSCGTQFSGWAWSYLSLPKCPSRPSFGQTPSILTTKSTRSGH